MEIIHWAEYLLPRPGNRQSSKFDSILPIEVYLLRRSFNGHCDGATPLTAGFPG